MKITKQLFDDYLRCKTKSYLRSRSEIGAQSEYHQWQAAQRKLYIEDAVAWLAEKHGIRVEDSSRLSDPIASSLVKRTIVTDVSVSSELLETTVQAVDLKPQKSTPGLPLVASLRFCTSNKLTRYEKLMAAFDGLVLSELNWTRFIDASIVHGDRYARTSANSPTLQAEARKVIKELAAIISATDPPELILNRHCAECEFQSRCHQRALEKDDLSLLPGMTEKERKKLHAKGIFTTTQLSYTYRPRRSSKHGGGRPVRYHHSLKALSLRLGKIHLLGSAPLMISGTPVYVDVEGLPEAEFYYLVGIRIQTVTGTIEKSFWADVLTDEQRMWNAFLKELFDIKAPQLLHYGGYEKVFFKRMIERYGFPARTPQVIQTAVLSSLNVLSAMYGKAYFPTFANGLKQVAGLLGAKWRTPSARGADSIMWRKQWEDTGDVAIKNRLMDYNQDDCEALHTLVSTLQRLIENPSQQSTDIGFPDDPKRLGTERGKDIHRTFDALLHSAHSDYKSAKISIRSKDTAAAHPKRAKQPSVKRKRPKSHGRPVTVRRKRKCPNHPGLILSPTRQISSCRVLDLIFTKAGCRKTVLHYSGWKAYCPLCQTVYVPPAIKRLKHAVFGRGWQVWAIYQRMVLRTSYRLISQAALDQFSEIIAPQNIQRFATQLSAQYARTEELLFATLLRSPALHIDETQLSIVGVTQYVWVFTDGSNVVFRLTETREAGFLIPLLDGYQGVVVSDFYAGYDALPCAQQKCVVHLVRELNDDLWKHPFNAEF